MPRLSIGVPVYNGERFLRQAVDSLLAQTFTDFQIVICDNASTDGTQKIAEELAAQDPRVRYHRNPENIGAAPNFNKVFELCEPTEFFKWAAHDDTCSPTFLEECIKILDADPGVLVAYTKTDFHNPEGDVIDQYDVTLQTHLPDRAKRYRALLGGHGCYEVFGVIRREYLIKTKLIGSYSRGDGVLLAHLAMYGRFQEHPEYLFHAGKHADQSMTMVDSWVSYSEWFDPALKNKMIFPVWRWTWELLRILPAGGIAPRDFIMGLRHWRRYVWRMRRRLTGDVAHQFRRLTQRSPRSNGGEGVA